MSTRIDPVFAEVAAALYGEAVDVRELWAIAKSMPGGPDVHVNVNPKKERKLAMTGLAATGVAGVGGLHALYLTGKDAPKAVKVGGKTALAGAAGWGALHTVELVGDSLATRAQMKTLAATKPKQAKKLKTAPTPVAKGALRNAAGLAGVVHGAQSAQQTARKGKAFRSAARKGRLILLTGTAAGAGYGGYRAGEAGARRRIARAPMAKAELTW